MAQRQSAHKARAALERSLAALTIGVPQAAEERQAALDDFGASEMDQYVHYTLRGTVSANLAWRDIELEFPYVFLDAVDPNATDTTLRTPHFVQPGVEWKRGPDIVVHVTLRSWVKNDYGFFTGAVVRIGAYAPRAGKVDDFESILHFTFSGYAAPMEDDSQG